VTVDPTIGEARRQDVAALAAHSSTIDVDGLELHLLDYPGAEPAIVVAPGITSPAIAWDFVVRALDVGRRFIVLDVRGRGLSGRPADGRYTLPAYAEDVEAVVDGLGLERPTLLGHSMGARIVVAAAARRPDVAGSVIAVDPPLSGPGRPPYPTTLESFRAQLWQAQAGISADDVRALYPAWPERELELRARWLETCDEEAVVRSHEGFHSEDFFDYWPLVVPPVSFVYGGDSPVVTAEGAAEASERNPRAELVRVPSAGHMIPWDNLDGFVQALRPLLAEAGTGTDG
jgi:N-formylmaleamate deformylase